MRTPSHWTWIPGLIVLAVAPAQWLLRTWTDPGYDSHGAWVALLCAALVARSIWSGPAAADPRAARRALGLWVVAATARLVGRLLDIDHIGALALVADVGAIALLLRLSRRPWPVAPWAIAGLFALSLPIEHLLQQLVSWPLRWVSSATAASILSLVWPDVQREGTVLMLPDGPLSIAVPCSGASGLVLLGTLAFAIACRRSPGLRGLVEGAVAVVAGAWATNTLRILLLAIGPTEQWLVEPAHSIVGLVALAAGATLPLLAARRMPDREPLPPRPDPSIPRHRPWAGVVFSLLALAAAQAPHRPLDVSSDAGLVTLPLVLGSWVGTDEGLSDEEELYFRLYGGSVQRVRYPTGADHVALLVSTTAPVRHLHSPRACLQSAGHTVERLGVREGVRPTVVWRTVDPDGQAWRVETTFMSGTGTTADSASEVVWRWLSAPGTPWMLVERVTRWEACEADPGLCEAFDHHLFASIEASHPTPES